MKSLVYYYSKILKVLSVPFSKKSSSFNPPNLKYISSELLWNIYHFDWVWMSCASALAPSSLILLLLMLSCKSCLTPSPSSSTPLVPISFARKSIFFNCINGESDKMLGFGLCCIADVWEIVSSAESDCGSFSDSASFPSKSCPRMEAHCSPSELNPRLSSTRCDIGMTSWSSLQDEEGKRGRNKLLAIERKSFGRIVST